MSDSKNLGLLVFHRPICSSCGISATDPPDDHIFKIGIGRITQIDGQWKAEGEGTYLPKDLTSPCPRCGEFSTAVLQAIPIECESYGCPICRRTDNLDYSVSQITRVGNTAFTFEVRIACKACKKQSRLTAVFKSILKAVKLKIGPGGVTIEKA